MPSSGGKTCADRKSTRLNSSHTIISYAVFCLKKKKTRCRPAKRFTHTPYSVLRGSGQCPVPGSQVEGKRDQRYRTDDDAVPGEFFFFLMTGPPQNSPFSPHRPLSR